MSNQNFERPESTDSNHGFRNQKMREAAGEAFAKASNTARDAAEKAKRATADAVSTMSGHVTGILNDQLGVGAQSANRLARSLRLAADDLARESPMLASLVRGFSHNVDNYAERLEGQSVEQLTQSASDFTRRQPALMFGLAAVAGFFAFRTVKNARSVSSPPIQPTQYNHASEDHG